MKETFVHQWKRRKKGDTMSVLAVTHGKNRVNSHLWPHYRSRVGERLSNEGPKRRKVGGALKGHRGLRNVECFNHGTWFLVASAGSESGREKNRGTEERSLSLRVREPEGKVDCTDV